MLKLDSGWSWFITLSACDYPHITHDGMQVLVLGISVSLCLYLIDDV